MHPPGESLLPQPPLFPNMSGAYAIGITLLLVAGRYVHPLRAHDRRQHRGSVCLARMAGKRSRWNAFDAPDHVRPCGGAAVDRARTAWLPGYERSSPVRIGNAAHQQHQLDVYGQVMASLHLARRSGLPPNENAWRVQRALLDFLETDWRKPDEGIREVRGPRRQFTRTRK
jgi:hypothetical protein